MPHHCQDLIALFNQLFAETEQTLLVGGAEEPLYLPQTETNPFNQVIFTRDYYASALHEIAHWCIAGPERRKLVDYGYWYQPDGRDAATQTLFEQVEVKPQAMEWVFSLAAGSKFQISLDNLTGEIPDNQTFKTKVQQQMLNYLAQGLPRRAEIFKNGLLAFYKRQEIFKSTLVPA